MAELTARSLYRFPSIVCLIICSHLGRVAPSILNLSSP